MIFFEHFYHFKYLFYFFVCLNSIYFIGHFLFCIVENKADSISKNVFSKMLVGAFFLLIVTSFYCTSFNTIQLAFLIPIIFLIKQVKRSKNFNISIHIKELLLLNLFSVIIIFFQYLFYGKLGTLNLLPIDMNNHAQLSFFMGNSGFESKFAELNSLNASNVPQRTPYHYSEIWLNVFLSKVLPSTNIGYTLIFITYPILYTIYLSGLYMLGQRYITKKGILFLLCVLGLFVGPLDFNYFRELFFEGHLFSNNTVIFENIGFFFNTLIFSYNGQKHIPIYLLSIVVIYFLIKKDIEKALIFISIAPIFNIGSLPSVFGSVMLYSLFYYIISKNIKKTILIALPTITITLFILVYYRINGGYDSEQQTDLLFLNSSLNTKGIILKMIFRLFYTFLFILVLYFPILFFSNKIKSIKKSNHFILFSFLLIFSGFCTRLILEGFNTPQFVTVVFPYFNIFVFVLIAKYYQTHNVFIISLFIFFFLVNFTSTKYHTQTRRDIDVFHTYSKSFVSEVLKELHNQKKPKIGYFLGYNEMENIKPGFWYGYYPCEFLFVNDYFKFYSLNFPNKIYKDNSTKSNNFSPNHLRYFMPNKYTEEQYNNQILSFTENNNIHFFVCKNTSKIPSPLKTQISDSIIDQLSGDKFYTLKF